MAAPTYLKDFRAYLDAEPTFSDLPAMEAEFYAGTDRPAVILQASNVENILQSLIVKSLRQPLPSDLRDRLFEGSGPMSSFSSKVLVGHALGLFGPVFRHDLDLIRELRNGFAHVRHPLQLTTPVIAGVCAHLQLPDHEMRRVPSAYGNLYPDIEVVADDNHPRTRFTVACHTISLFMIDNINGAGFMLP